MRRLVRRFAPFRGTESLRLTVSWRGTRVRRVKLEYLKPHMLRRVVEAVRR